MHKILSKYLGLKIIRLGLVTNILTCDKLKHCVIVLILFKRKTYALFLCR